MTIQPGTTLYGVWDEMTGGWLCDHSEHLLSTPRKLDTDSFTYWKRVYGDPTHTHTVQPFVVPAPGEMG